MQRVKVVVVGSKCVCRRVGVERFRGWHVLKLELALSSPGIEFALCFCIGCCGFFNKKCSTWQATLYKNMLSSPFRIVFFQFPMVAFRIGFYGVIVDSRLFAHASLDFHLYFSSVQGCG